MDKEALKTIERFLNYTEWHSSIAVQAETILGALMKLGYHKLPEDKPPLLSDEEIRQIHTKQPIRLITDISPRNSREANHQVAQAQREADIEFYNPTSKGE